MQLTEKELKLGRLALDRACQPGERSNAATKLIESWFGRGSKSKTSLKLPTRSSIKIDCLSGQGRLSRPGKDRLSGQDCLSGPGKGRYGHRTGPTVDVLPDTGFCTSSSTAFLGMVCGAALISYDPKPGIPYMVSTAVAAPTPALPVVTSEEQRLALPLGTNYTDRQGRLYTRSEWDASPKPTPTPTPVTVKRAQPVKRVLDVAEIKERRRSFPQMNPFRSSSANSGHYDRTKIPEHFQGLAHRHLRA
jgi:hypothetical protein